MRFQCALGIFALIVCFEKPAHAQNQPWCIYKNYGDGYGDCRYATLQQCLTDRLGTGASCGLNPRPTSPEPRTRSPRRS
ncbi:MAG: DUF3551 domain-containing protein [Betaproteobacteria bacterium]